MNNYQERQKDAEAWRDIFRDSVAVSPDTADLVQQGNRYSELGNDIEAIMCYRLASIQGGVAAKKKEENEIHKMDCAPERKSVYPDVTARNWLRADVPFGVAMEGRCLVNHIFERVKVGYHHLGYEIVHEQGTGLFNRQDRVSICFSESDIQEIKYERSATGKLGRGGVYIHSHRIEIKLCNKVVKLLYEPEPVSIMGIPLFRYRHTESVLIS